MQQTMGNSQKNTAAKVARMTASANIIVATGVFIVVQIIDDSQYPDFLTTCGFYFLVLVFWLTSVLIFLRFLIAQDSFRKRSYIYVVAHLASLTILAFATRISIQAYNRLGDAANLKNIGLSILLYSGNHSGRLPPSLEDLAKEEGIGPNVFISPSLRKKLGSRAGSMDRLSSYEYVGNGVVANLSNANRVVIAYGRDPGVLDGHISVLFLDCHVETHKTKEPSEFIKKRVNSGECFCVVYNRLPRAANCEESNVPQVIDLK